MTDFPVTIFHNPACGTSRNTLGIITAAGYAPKVVEYVQVGWTKPQLLELLAAMKATPRDILREKGSPPGELGLLEPGVTDDQILDAMVAHPLLVNRPIVVTPNGTVLARPSEKVAEVLERTPASYVKEDGETLAF
ncbi:MAG: arsenate reductase (glutaredoxin) [Phenylobacterium zucineum]|nr:MAG: arsenate reductase (glutaredoxin) [Phenylobacterium zucineum]